MTPEENIPGNISWMLGRETLGDGGESMAEAEARVDAVCDAEAGSEVRLIYHQAKKKRTDVSGTFGRPASKRGKGRRRQIGMGRG